MLTGLYPRHHRLAINGMALPANVPVVTDALATVGYRTHGIGKHHLQPLLAPKYFEMPDSRAFWTLPQSRNFNGPYYGYQSVDLLLGESDTAHLAGHYANWLREHHRESVDLLLPHKSPEPPPPDLDEIWRCAIPVEHHYNTWVTDRAVDFIEHNASGARPFYLFVSYPDPHHPFDPPVEYADRFSADKMSVPQVSDAEKKSQLPYYGELYPTGEGFRELYWQGRQDLEAGSMITTDLISEQTLALAIAYTHAAISMLDDQVGRMLGSLERAGIKDNTIIIFTSDHGELLADHGLLHKGPPPYRQLTEIPLLIQGPGIPQGAVADSLTNHVDLAPTILAAAGADFNDHQFDGIALTALIDDPELSLRDYDFGEYHPTSRMELYNQSVRTDKWRLTLYPQCPKWGELFDLTEDPHERLNRYLDPAMQTVVEQLRQVLTERFAPCPKVDNEWICKW